PMEMVPTALIYDDAFSCRRRHWSMSPTTRPNRLPTRCAFSLLIALLREMMAAGAAKPASYATAGSPALGQAESDIRARQRLSRECCLLSVSAWGSNGPVE